MLLVSVVFIYTPGDLFVTQILGEESSFSNPTLWIVYGVIFAYYAMATLFPIDKIIGKIYPVFGAILLLSAVGVFIGLFAKGYPLQEIWDVGFFGAHPFGERFLPMFFVTVTCGILSGFHATQATLISRTVTDERDGRMVFYDMMIAEGFIAMTWAAAAMGALGLGLVAADTLHASPTLVVGTVAKEMLGDIGGIIAIVGVIVLPITSGDTALRSLRVMLGDAFGVDQTKKKSALALAIPIFTVVALVLFYAKSDAKGFNILWRYFSWANETIGVFALAMIAVYMMKNRMPYLMALIPGSFYMYVVSVYILNAQIGFRLPLTASFIGAAALTALYWTSVRRTGKAKK